MLRHSVALLLVVAACSSPAGSQGPGCAPPAFATGACADEPERTVCKVGDETWILYATGEQWRYREPDGKTDPVICHSAADGTILWQQTSGD